MSIGTMRILVILGIWLYMVFDISAGATTRPMLLTLYTRVGTWNEGARVCEDHGMTMVTPSTEASSSVLLSGIQFWQNQSNDIPNIWLGLHGTAASGDAHFIWNDCTSLDETRNWTNWLGSEPAQGSIDMCIEISATEYKWQTVSCMERYHFICEAPLDSCWFDTLLSGTLKRPTVYYDSSSKEHCRELCLNYSSAMGECTAMSFDVDGTCSLLIGDMPLVFDDPEVTYLQSAVTDVKRCHWYDISNEHFPYSRLLELFPMYDCTHPAAPNVLEAKDIVNTTVSVIPQQEVTSSCSCEPEFSTLFSVVETPQICPSPSTEFVTTTVSQTLTETLTETNTVTNVMWSTTFLLTSVLVTHTYTEFTVSSLPCTLTRYPYVRSEDEPRVNISELKLENTQLSSNRRKKQSAVDTRPSATFVGTLAIALIISLMVGIVVLDFGRVVTCVRKVIRRRKKKLLRQQILGHS